METQHVTHSGVLYPLLLIALCINCGRSCTARSKAELEIAADRGRDRTIEADRSREDFDSADMAQAVTAKTAAPSRTRGATQVRLDLHHGHHRRAKARAKIAAQAATEKGRVASQAYAVRAEVPRRADHHATIGR